MKKSTLFLFLLFSLSCVYAQNPLLLRGNTPTPYNRITVKDIRLASTHILTQASKDIARIAQLKPASVSRQNLLVAYDHILDALEEFEATLSLLSATHPRNDVRATSDSVIQALDKFSNEQILLNANLYNVFKNAVTKLPSLTPQEQRFLQRTVSDFERTGISLPADKQKKLKHIQSQVLYWSQQFDRNIAEHKDSLVVTEADMKGVSEALKTKSLRANGTYVLNLASPTYQEVLTNGQNETLRKALWIKYNNRAYPKNVTVLDSLLFYRNALANLLGFGSYARYALENKMAKTSATVWAFERGLAQKLAGPVQQEREELTEMKRSLGDASPLQPWDVFYYQNLLLQKKFAVNSNEVKEYFPLASVMEGVFTVYQKLYGIEIKPSGQYPVWMDKVTTYDIFKDGKKAGIFYLDMYPRDGKYTHFACSPMRVHRVVNGNNVLPMAALICNFPEPTDASPSLLNMGQVETLFHEFGHLIHAMFLDTPLAMQSWGYTGDFIEAPSQIMENWAWNYDVLSLFARHHKTGELIPRELVEKLNRSRYLGAATGSMTQVFYGTFDMTLHDRYDSIRNIPVASVSHALRQKLGLPFNAEEHFFTGMGHLSGYAANYYGYLWSAVYAEDMFSVFEKEGVLSPAVGKRYREKILSQGLSRDDLSSIKDFLGREPDTRAFIRSLGLTP